MPITPPRHIRTTNMLVIDKVFGMGNGYVLNFTAGPDVVVSCRRVR